MRSCSLSGISLPRFSGKTPRMKVGAKTAALSSSLFDGYGLHRVAGCGDQGLEDALMALWAAATRAIGTR
jgi:hypothetical protein